MDNSNKEHLARMGYYHPSSVGYCKRAVVMNYTKVLPTDLRSKQFQEIVTLGHKVHDIVQQRLEDLEHYLKTYAPTKGLTYNFVREVRYDPKDDILYQEFNIGGTTDGILELSGMTDGDAWTQRGVVEIKSQNNDRHETLEPMTKAYPEHLMQSHLYAFRFKLPIIWIWYYNKNNSKPLLRPHIFENRIFDEALNYFIECDIYVHKGQLPPREESYFECKECIYRTLCSPSVLRRKRPVVTPLTQIRRK